MKNKYVTTAKTKNFGNPSKPCDKLTDEAHHYQVVSKKQIQENLEWPSLQSYNITIGATPQFIWFRNAKVGTRSIFELFNSLGIQLEADSPFNVHYPPLLFKDYFKFGFVRNPWDRVISFWHNKILNKKKPSFLERIKYAKQEKLETLDGLLEFLETQDLSSGNTHYRWQSANIDLNEVNFIGRFENFSQDLQRVLFELGFPPTSIPHKNNTKKRKPYQDYYNLDQRKKVAKLYEKDIQLFGYTF